VADKAARSHKDRAACVIRPAAGQQKISKFCGQNLLTADQFSELLFHLMTCLALTAAAAGDAAQTAVLIVVVVVIVIIVVFVQIIPIIGLVVILIFFDFVHPLSFNLAIDAHHDIFFDLAERQTTQLLIDLDLVGSAQIAFQVDTAFIVATNPRHRQPPYIHADVLKIRCDYSQKQLSRKAATDRVDQAHQAAAPHRAP
jgi:hypothetical protein